ncbi:MAG: aspartate--tRNA ligase [Chitinophagaceae bacterium]|nr:aspartate--tRNA ligase [Chitinophagaceae bacterium]
MYRTITCGALRIADKGKTVTLAGWVQTIRKFGSITFVDLRDRYGITQLVFDEKETQKLESENVGREFVLQATGSVRERSNKNKNIPTGEIEIEIHSFKVLNPSVTPPFTIQDDTDGGEDLRMKYRYLDLRRNVLRKNLELRYSVTRATRNYLHSHNFIEIETPYLIKSTPEGARDFVVPSRMNAHEFYALPQSPQTFKQLLMVSGFDRYYQIVKCFRDEDLRADRQPEFTQIDCEMSFVEQEDILQTFEGLIKSILKDVKGIDLKEPLQRMSFADAMWNYGNDKPDIRFEMLVKNLKTESEIHLDALKGSSFGVFEQAETILAISVPGAADYSRKQTDELTDWVRRPQIGMAGLAYIKYHEDGSLKSSIDKFFSPDKLIQFADFCGSKKGDLILILAGKEEKTRKAISELRLFMGDRLGLRDNSIFKLLWVTDFPLFEYEEENNRWVARHHPFTSPKPEDIDTMIHNSPVITDKEHYLKHPFAAIKANAYDMVMNGNEIGGGSIRIHQKDLQKKMFEALAISDEEANEKFGFLMNAFQYGAPPHGGIAFGLDRVCAILGGSESIRDFIAFPKNNNGRDMMIDAPSPIEDKQLKELSLALGEIN